jgi:hypothetical protein
MTITTTQPGAAWHWSDHWNPHPPDGWDGRHELSARGYGAVFETAGVILSCSCGQEASATKAGDDGGPIPLAALNRLAGTHIWGAVPS